MTECPSAMSEALQDGGTPTLIARPGAPDRVGAYGALACATPAEYVIRFAYDVFAGMACLVEDTHYCSTPIHAEVGA